MILPAHPLPDQPDQNVRPGDDGPAATVAFDGDGRVDLRSIEAIARGEARIEITEGARARMARASARLDVMKDENCLIYGVTTGFGPLARSYVDRSLSEELQRNLVYHLASGVGPLLDRRQARAVAAARLATLVRGHSAVRPEVAGLMADMLNAGLAPAIPCKGTVGASGDLTPLAHLALALMGEGAFLSERRGTVPAPEALARAGLAPLTLRDKDGLALVNGISVTAGIAALNGVSTRRMARLALAAGLAYTECLGGHRAAWHPQVGALRPHPGQREAHDLLWAWSADAARLDPVELRPMPLDPSVGRMGVLEDQPLPQDPYTMRCLPQLVGAVFDTLAFHDRSVETDLNAVSDNPLIFPEADGSSEGSPVVLHAGNFFGQHGAFASDALTNGVIALAGLFERQIARITDPVLNGALPAFLQARPSGLHSGFMGAQVTASALLAELRAKAAPASIQSIPTNGNNQDVVPLGTVAARRAAEALEDTTRIAAILVLALAQAADLTRSEAPLSASTQRLVTAVRAVAPFLDADRPLASDIEAVATALADGRIAV